MNYDFKYIYVFTYSAWVIALVKLCFTTQTNSYIDLNIFMRTRLKLKIPFSFA